MENIGWDFVIVDIELSVFGVGNVSKSRVGVDIFFGCFKFDSFFFYVCNDLIVGFGWWVFFNRYFF